MAEEKVSLFGLVIVAGRLVNFPKRDRKNIAEARSIFLQAALIEDNITGRYPFLEHNQQLIEKWRQTEDKLRTTAIVYDDTTLFTFYESRLPAQVCDRASLNKWLKRNDHKQLMMSDDDIVRNRPDEKTLADFPPVLHVGTLELRNNFV